ncbi:hypothetical protein I4U23_023124 [Adineta vaga]|nr:hypothetical protein I4U23_023124 [Adineta vaga]
MVELRSPFDFKDELIALAGGESTTSQPSMNTTMINAGRGNPNFLATTPRYAFCQLMLFALRESELRSTHSTEGIGSFPEYKGIEERFELFLHENKNSNGITFLCDMVLYIRKQFKIDMSKFLYEICEGILGINYPVPGRILALSEKIVNHYLCKELSTAQPMADGFHLFAVEGGTAAITSIFNSLRANYLLNTGDKIALGTPIFSPYLEMSDTNDYQFELRDVKVKAFFLINPSNPQSVKLDKDSLDYIATIVAERPDLIILTDDVYGTFAEQFVSLFAICPRNTILVYSYSKYFGATGWRLGVIGIHNNNIFDDQIASLDNTKRNDLHKRYSSLTSDPYSFKFNDRLVADSRSIVLNHTAGLSTPQQVQMVLFSLFALMDTSNSYKTALKQLIQNRKHALYRAIGIASVNTEEDVNAANYYTIIDLELLSECLYGQQFASWFLSCISTREFLRQLATDTHVVLLPGDGFGIRHPAVRVSLANLNENDYILIGEAL